MTLDSSSAAKVFEKAKTYLTHVRGVMGVPIVYILRHQLIPEDKDDDTSFRVEDTKYNSIDQETIARASILTNKANYNDEYETLKTNGPFCFCLPHDLKKVWSILHKCFGSAGTW